MVIYLNGHFLLQRMTGVQRYGQEVIAAIDQLIDKNGFAEFKNIRFVLLKPKGAIFPKKLKHIEEKEIKHLERVAWAQFLLPFYSRDGFLLSFCNQAPLLKSNQSVVIHDAYIVTRPKMFRNREVCLWSYIYKKWSQNRMNIITISSYSRNILKWAFKFAEERLHVIGEGYEHVLRVIPDEGIMKRLDIPGCYVLAVGGSRNKNFSLLMKACQDEKANFGKLVIAGNIDREYTKELNQSQKAIIAGYVTDAELMCLYHHASCFVFPSVEEGFGIPPLEAMALGCPVLSANTTALPETCGNGAIYFDPHNVDEVVEKLNQITTSEVLRTEMVEKGKENVKRFSWNKTAKEILKVVREQIDG